MDKARAKQYATELTGSDVGGWRIQKFIDNGKSAAVFEATKGDQKAALKIIDRELELRYGREKQQGRIELEARLIGKSHPHLVEIYGAGRCTATGLLFVAMEYLPYGNLEDRIPTFPSDKIWPTIEKIASAAEFLEQLDIVHRDIKPANVAISEDLTTVKLLDLGICRPSAEDAGNGTGNHFIGTLRYSPPEFVFREEQRTTAGYRAITFYQLGAILHDMIMHRRIFHNIDKPEAKLIEAVRSIEPALNPAEIPPEGLIRLAKSCLLKKPQIRTQIVKWTSFKQPQPDQDIAAIKDEMAMRQRHLEQRSALESEQVDAARVFEELVAGLDFAIRDVVQTSSVYPPLIVERHTKKQNHVVHASVRASDKHELKASMSFVFVISLLDARSRTVSIRYIAVLRSLDQQQTIDALADWCSEKGDEAYIGPFDIAELKMALDPIMLKKFRAATEMAHPTCCQIL